MFRLEKQTCSTALLSKRYDTEGGNKAMEDLECYYLPAKCRFVSSAVHQSGGQYHTGPGAQHEMDGAPENGESVETGGQIATGGNRTRELTGGRHD